MYKDVCFKMEQLEQIEDDLKEAKSIYGSIDRIFLVNGDASFLKADYLKSIALKIKKYFPECKTITMYASIQNIKAKTDEELKELRGLGINDLYVGIESGVEEVVSHINKGHSVEEAKKQLARLNKFNITHMALLMLGVAGKGNGERNAKQTAKLLNETKPGLIWVGTLGVFEGTKMHEEVKEGTFIEVSEMEKSLDDVQANEDDTSVDGVTDTITGQDNDTPPVGRGAYVASEPTITDDDLSDTKDESLLGMFSRKHKHNKKEN